MEYRIIRMSDHDQCGCCGRKGLKRTVHMEIVETGEEVFYGVDCAASSLRQRYHGKRYPVSREAVKSMAVRAARATVPVLLVAA